LRREEFREGGYAYLPGGAFPFSNGVAALPGFAFTRVRLRRPRPLAEALSFAADWLGTRGIASAALANCELRSPAPLSRAEFGASNDAYVRLLRQFGFGAAAGFPVGRSNVAPQFQPPERQLLFAFTYAAPTQPTLPAVSASGGRGPDFVISGKAELSESPPSIAAEGDVSPQGILAKASYVVGDLRHRVEALGGRWQDVTGAQLYCVHPIEESLELLRRERLMDAGLTVYRAYPPVTGLEFEVDVRSVSVEHAA
jgi:hypothetical protein